MRSEDVVLSVSIDGTLIRSSLSDEILLCEGPGRRPNIFRLIRRFIFGRYFPCMGSTKQVTTAPPALRPALLPYRDEVLRYIADANAQGRKVILVSAADQHYVDAIAHHLGGIDAAYGSTGYGSTGYGSTGYGSTGYGSIGNGSTAYRPEANRRLGGTRTADFLTEISGESGFDHLGSGKADRPVWQKARRVISVGREPDPKWTGSGDDTRIQTLARDPSQDGWRSRCTAYLRALRPHQWFKNLLVFLPLLAAHRFDWETLVAGCIAFATFSLAASSAYILNDITDIFSDRAHDTKSKRSIASGRVPIGHGLAMAAASLIVSIALGAVFLPTLFFPVLAIYYAATLAYSVSLRRLLLIDICTLAGLYTLRVVAGGAATGLLLSPWLLAFAGFLFLSLAAMKRQAELVNSQNLGQQLAAGRGYQPEDLPIVAIISVAAGYLSVLVLALYINSTEVTLLYPNPYLLWGTCPILLYWLSRLVILAHRGQMDDDPVIFAIRDPVSLVCGVGMVFFAFAGILF
jgi:4-hydroxybenzoate polyprenyltransferase